MTKKAELSWSALFRGQRGLYCLSLTTGIVLYAIITPISYTILPAIIRDLHAELYYSLIAVMFALGSLLGACLLSHSLRLMKPHIAYICSLIGFALCTLGCAYAPSLFFLLAVRLLQGFTGGLLVALTYNMLNTALPPALLPRGFGLIFGMWGIATLIGPYIGGAFANWRIPFFAVGLIALVFCVFVFLLFEKYGKEQHSKNRALPVAAPFLPILILTLLVTVISLGGVWEGLQPGFNAILAVWHFSLQINISPLTAAAIGLSLGFLLVLLLAKIEKKAGKKLLPTGTFTKNSLFFLIYSIIILNMVALGGTKLYLPLFLQELHHAGPISSGYIAFTDSIGWTIGSLIGAEFNINATAQIPGRQFFYKTSRFGKWMVFVAAPSLCVIGMAVVFTFIALPSYSNTILLFMGFGFFLAGFFSGVFWPHILALVLQNAKNEEKEAADSSVCIVQFFAPALADCLAGLVVNGTGFKVNNVNSVSQAAFILFALCLALLIIVVLLFLKLKTKVKNQIPH